MKWTSGALMLALALVLAGCGEERAQTIRLQPPAAAVARTTADTAASPPEPRSGGVRATVDLTPALLRPEDMPSGWTTTAAPLPDAYDVGFFECPVLTSQPLDETSVGFILEEFQPSWLFYVSHTVKQFADGEAKQAIEEAVSVFESCTTWSSTTSEGAPITYTLAPLSFPKLGDQTFALTINIKSGGGAMQVHVVYLRRDNAMAQLSVLVAGVHDVQLDPDLTKRLARKADARLAAIQ